MTRHDWGVCFQVIWVVESACGRLHRWQACLSELPWRQCVHNSEYIWTAPCNSSTHAHHQHETQALFYSLLGPAAAAAARTTKPTRGLLGRRPPHPHHRMEPPLPNSSTRHNMNARINATISTTRTPSCKTKHPRPNNQVTKKKLTWPP